MRKTNKIFTAILLAAMAISISACGNKTEESTQTGQVSQATPAAATSEATQEPEETTEASTEETAAPKSEATAAPKQDDKDENNEKATEKENYEGIYTDSKTGKANIEVSCEDEESQLYSFDVNWKSEGATYVWSFKANLDANGSGKYKNCTKLVEEETEDGDGDPLEEYSDGTGTVSIKEGVLKWSDDEENYARGTKFVKE